MSVAVVGGVWVLVMTVVLVVVVVMVLVGRGFAVRYLK